MIPHIDRTKMIPYERSRTAQKMQMVLQLGDKKYRLYVLYFHATEDDGNAFLLDDVEDIYGDTTWLSREAVCDFSVEYYKQISCYVEYKLRSDAGEFADKTKTYDHMNLDSETVYPKGSRRD